MGSYHCQYYCRTSVRRRTSACYGYNAWSVFHDRIQVFFTEWRNGLDVWLVVQKIRLTLFNDCSRWMPCYIKADLDYIYLKSNLPNRTKQNERRQIFCRRSLFVYYALRVNILMIPGFMLEGHQGLFLNLSKCLGFDHRLHFDKSFGHRSKTLHRRVFSLLRVPVPLSPPTKKHPCSGAFLLVGHQGLEPRTDRL